MLYNLYVPVTYNYDKYDGKLHAFYQGIGDRIEKLKREMGIGIERL